MTQDQCLQLPSHATHLGVCYPENSFSIQISSPDHPQPATFTATSVPEPSTPALFAVALVLSVLSLRIRVRGTKVR
jgi:hypothetical protein